MMTSKMLGTDISQTEISNISRHGLWILCQDQEYFLSYEDFPWFNTAQISQIFNVEEPHPGHLYWPDLDVDLCLEILENPQHFPLKATI